MKESPPLPIGFPSGGIPDNSAEEAVWVGFQTRYRDIFMSQYITVYCFAYNQARATFAGYGGPKYNCHRKLTDKERKIAEARQLARPAPPRTREAPTSLYPPVICPWRGSAAVAIAP